MTQLQSLDLSWNNIGDLGAAALANNLQYVTQLQSLVLSRNRIGATGAAALANNLQGTNVKEINLYRNNISDQKQNAGGTLLIAPTNRKNGKLGMLASVNPTTFLKSKLLVFIIDQ